jgi:hypothetical protein
MNVDPEKIQAMISILQSMLTSDSTNNSSSETIAVQEPAIQTKPIQNNFSTKSKNNFSGHYNKFDSMSEKNMHKEDVAIDQKLRTQPPVLRNREYQPVSVRCRVCGKQENVNPQVLTGSELERYKCNKCSSTPG